MSKSPLEILNTLSVHYNSALEAVSNNRLGAAKLHLNKIISTYTIFERRLEDLPEAHDVYRKTISLLCDIHLALGDERAYTSCQRLFHDYL